MTGTRTRRVKLPAGALSSQDLSQPKETSAIPELGKLVTPTILEPEVEDVVLATNEELEKSYMEALKFNEEPVTIVIHEDTSEHPIDPVVLAVNGKSIYLKRGEEYTIPRKFVECLCNPMAHVSTKVIRRENGEEASEIKSTRAFQFPFSVVKDENPNGRKWLKALMAR